MKIAKGFKFLHKNWTRVDGTPLLHVVTKVQGGIVYYRPVYDDGSLGGPSWCEKINFPMIIKEEKS